MGYLRGFGGAGLPAPHSTSGKAVGEEGAQGVAAGRAVGLQHTVIQEVARPLRREGGAFALHHAELTHHAGEGEREEGETPRTAGSSCPGHPHVHLDLALSAGLEAAGAQMVPLRFPSAARTLLHYQNKFQILGVSVSNNY